MNRKSLLKCAAVLSLAIAGVGVAQSVTTTGVAYAAINTSKPGTLTAAVGKATIAKVQENANKQIEMDYTLEITLPKDVKSGDTIRMSTINLGDFIPAGDTKAPVLIEGVEVGTLSRVENVNKRYEQNSPESTLAQKKAANIEAGTQDNTYVLTFNSKAAEYSNKSASLKASSNLTYATTVKVNTPIRGQIFMNGNLLATKDYTLTATAPAEPVKSQKSAIDFTRNTRMQVVKTGDTTSSQNFLGMIVMPLDRDYGVGSTVEIELPADSMMKFVPASDYKGDLALTHFPVLSATTEVNSNNVYLYDQQTVKVKPKSITDNKMVLEVTEGTLRKGDSYVGLPNQTGVNFALTSKAEGKINADGTNIGTETVKSALKTPDGTAGETQGNSLSITINGAKINAQGIKDILAKKVSTSWIVRASNKSLKDKVTGDTTLPKEDFAGHKYITSETDAEGNVIHYYEVINTPVAKKITTDWMYTTGEKLKETFTGDEAKPKEDFTAQGAIFKETKVDKDGNTVHLYVKAEKPAVKKVTNFVDIDTGQPVAPTEDGEQPKKEINGYTFVETKTDKDGVVTHYYKKVAETPSEKKVTRYLEQGTNKVLDKEVDGVQPKKDIKGYTFVETTTKDGVTTHFYKAETPAAKKVTRYLEQGTNKVLDKEVDGVQPKKDIKGYTFVETTTKDGVTTHFYKAAIKPKTRFVDIDTKKDIVTAEDGKKDKRNFDGYDFVESKTNDKTGETVHYYRAKPKTAAKTTTKAADKKAPVETGGAVSGAIAPLVSTALAALTGGATWFGIRKRNK